VHQRGTVGKTLRELLIWTGMKTSDFAGHQAILPQARVASKRYLLTNYLPITH